MTGRVKMYNEDKGYGFIVGEDGSDYFVHASAVSGTEPLYRGANVTFNPSENERGKIAKTVSMVDTAKQSSFIQLGNVRVKLGNIKNYGISKCDSYYYKVYEYDPQLAKQIEDSNRKKRGLFKTLSSLFSEQPYKWKGKKIYIASFSKEDALRKAGIDPYYPNGAPRAYKQEPDGTLELCDGGDFLEIEESYLYVTTYQNDNFRFPEGSVSFNIFDKCKEIDSYML